MLGRSRFLLSLFFLASSSWAIYESRGWPFSARLFPLLAAVPLVALAVSQLGVDMFEAQGKARRTMDFEFASGIEPSLARRRTLTIMAWLFGFGLAIWMLGFHIAIPLAVFLYLKCQGQESWKLSFGLTLAIYLFFWGVFDQLLHLPFPEPRLLLWFRING